MWVLFVIFFSVGGGVLIDQQVIHPEHHNPAPICSNVNRLNSDCPTDNIKH